MKTYNDWAIWASGEFLTDYLPVDFEGMAEDDLHIYIQEHLISQYEYSEGAAMMKLIACLATSAMGFAAEGSA